MNQLINDIFGDTYITLNCRSGECLRLGDVPGFVVSAGGILSLFASFHSEMKRSLKVPSTFTAPAKAHF